MKFILFSILILLSVHGRASGQCFDLFHKSRSLVTISNAEEFYKSFSWPQGSISLDIGALNVGYQYPLLAGHPPFYLKEILSKDGVNYAEMIPLFGGQAYYFRIETNSNSIILYPLQFLRVVNERPIADLERQFYAESAALRQFSFLSKINSDYFAFKEQSKIIALAQASVSNTLQGKSDLKTLTRVIQKMLLDLEAHKMLTIKDLEEMNYELTADFLSSFHRIVAGIVRGTPERTVVYEGEKYPVDLSELDIHTGTQPVRFLYIAPQEVPGRLDQLVDGINQISQSTPLRNIVKIYREFIIIHPFIDGNGRLSRLLLDYMLLKSGHPALKHNPKTARVLFKSLDQLYREILEASLEVN